MRLICSDFGKGHPTIKLGWIGVIAGLASSVLAFQGRQNQWELAPQFYFLWSEIPVPPSLIGWMIFNIVLIALAVISAITTGKHEIHIYDNCIDGCGFKFWGFFLHDFKLKYADINSVKKHKWGLTIRTTMGRYSVFVHNPTLCADTIQLWKYNSTDNGVSVYEKNGDAIDVVSANFGRLWRD